MCVEVIGKVTERHGTHVHSRTHAQSGNRFSRTPSSCCTAKCADCGKSFELPHEPKQGKPVYCPECVKRYKGT